MVMLPLSSAGVSYCPDGAIDTLAPPRPPRRLWLTAVFFLGSFMLLQWAWSEARGTWVERLVIDQMTVKTAAWLIDTLDPAIGVQAVGSRLKAAGGGLNILNGCEGTEVAFLLACAMLVAPMAWRARLLGLAVGCLLVFVLNQGRVLALFYAFRADRTLFDALHGIIAPLLLILAASAFFLAWLNRYGPRIAASIHISSPVPSRIVSR